MPEPDVDRVLTEYDDEYLECRGLSHLWQRVGYFRDGAYISLLTQCMRCRTRRIQTMTRDGEFIRRGYDYAEGYTVTGMYLERRDVRRESIRRANGMIFTSEEALLNGERPPTQTVAQKRAARKGA